MWEAYEILPATTRDATVISLCGQYIMGPILTELVEAYNGKDYSKFKSLVYKIVKLIILFGIVIEVAA